MTNGVCKMQFDNSYFQDEIREGFYVPGMIKRSWAMQLEVLQKINEICEKYNFRWFADCGTLLGAVRHRGFIPWDDDLDICMFRDDYIKFNEIVEKELPAEYKILNLDTEVKYDSFLTRIVASDSINIGNDYLMSHHGFPYIAGVDIFPLDYLYSDEGVEEIRRKKAMRIWDLTQNIKDKRECRSEDEIRKYVLECTGYCLDSSLPIEAALLRILEKIFSECKDESSNKVTLMPIYLKNKAHVYPIKWYDKIIILPFENSTIKAPAAYEKILKVEYGRWYVTNRNGSLHEYPFYSEQESILLKSKGAAPYRYVYNGVDETLKIARRDHAISIDEKAKLIASMENLHEQILILLEKGKNGQAVVLLEKCQELAITVGMSIEEEQGEGTLAVKLLEKYCELVYDIHEKLLKKANINIFQERKRLEKLYLSIKNSYYNDSRGYKEILFMPVHASDWKYMLPLYEEYSEAENTDVYVMPAIYFEREDDGSMIKEQTDFVLFSEKLPLVKPNDIDFDKLHPDAIIIQNPFDEFESGFTVHPFFYSTNLYKYTEKLIYCHSFDIDDIDKNDQKALKNAEKFVVTPGVLLADEIYVPNENMKEVYLNILASLPQNNPREWDLKIKIMPISVKRKETLNEIKPSLVFHISDGDYISYKEVFERLKHSIRRFNEAKEKLNIVWVEEKTTTENIKIQLPDCYEEYIAIKNDFVTRKIGSVIYVDEAVKLISEAVGYYGSAGYLMNLCIKAKIPVMLWKGD